MKPPLIRVWQLYKTYRGRRVLEVEDLAFRQGKITAIIGPSGAGKTTLLRLIDLLEEPTGGEIYFRGRCLTRDKKTLLEWHRRVSMVFQNPVLFATSVYENIAYGLRVRGEKGEIMRRKVEKAMELVGLPGYGAQPARRLSGGEAQRVAIARAIVVEPEILLLDEPTANLDPANVAMIEEIIRKTNRAYGTTVVMVTHNMFQAKRLADEMVFLLAGRVVEAGKAAEIFSRPGDPRTLSFINGEMVY